MKKILLMICVAAISIGFPTVNAESSGYGFGIPSEGKFIRPYCGKKYEKMFEHHNVFYIGEEKKEIYLTFDVGYENGNTSKILDVLQERHIKACFFITGDFLKKHPDLVIRMVKEGHIVGNHTWSHPDLSKISEEKIIREIETMEVEFKNITGQDIDHYIRPPYGRFDEHSLQVTDELGYNTIFWSLAYVDWYTDNQRGWHYAYESVTERIHDGAIILMHTVSTDNRDALDDIITEIEQEGYVFKTLDDLVFNIPNY